MSATKISDLTAATTISTSDTVPIVQGGTTKRATFSMLNIVSVKDGSDPTKVMTFDVSNISTATTRTVTAPNSNTTLPIISQVLTISGPTQARTITVPDANFTAARTDSANTFTGASTATSWNLVTPALGTPASGVLTNCTGYVTSNLTDGADLTVKAYQALGSVIKGQSIGINAQEISLTQALSDGRVVFHAVYIPVSATITGVKWIQGIQGNYTADNYNGVGLYTYSGGTLTLVASSTDDGNIWKVSAGAIASKAFSATYSATAGLYFVATHWNASATVTAPQLACGAGTSAPQNSLDFTNSAALKLNYNSQTALPSSVAASATDGPGGNFIWIAVY